MTKRQKSYSVAETVQYHKDRLQSKNVTENQKTYSRQWLVGFSDAHTNNNLVAAQDELKERQQYVENCKKEIAEQQRELKVVKTLNKTVLGGYINGLKAKLKRK